MKVPFLDLSGAYLELQGEIDAAIQRVVASGWYLLGEELAAFEAELAAYCGTEHAVGVANGLDALRLILQALDVGPGDEVIVPAHTFVATWLAVSQVGATPVPVEPVEGTFNIDAARVAAAITPRTRAIMPVHLYGQPAEMTALTEIGERAGIPVIEDAAQAHGARFRGRRAGGLGLAAGWSFYPGKNLGAFGDGGAITTNDARLAERLRMLRNYGSRTKYIHEEPGLNSRLDEIQAAVLRVKLRKLDEWNARRRAIAAEYRNALADTALKIPMEADGAESVWHLFAMRARRRDEVMKHLADRGVQTLIHYPVPSHLQQCYAHLHYARGAFPIAEAISDQVLSLPIGPHMPAEHVSHVIESLRDAPLD